MSGSTSRSIRSRAVSLPRERCRSTDCSPPPRATCAVRSRSSATSAAMRSCRRANSSDALDLRGQDGHARSLSGAAGLQLLGLPRALQQLSVPLSSSCPPSSVGVLRRPAATGSALLVVIATSYYFYAYADWWFPALMAGSTAISYTAGRLLEHARPERRRKLVLAIGIAGVLALLAYFKYTAFVGGYALDFVHVITRRASRACSSFVNSIVLPIGISFYTFEGISYMVDVYRGDAARRARPAALRVLHLVLPAPDRRADRPLRDPPAAADAEASLRRRPRALGAAALHARPREEGAARRRRSRSGSITTSRRRARLGFVNAWACAVGFGFQIYFDFSAYSDMALGLARIFGIELPWNFDRPYRSASPTEFWRRWHVTLSTWLRDYLYIPLGGNRKGERRRDLNLLVTMGLGGLWHGASLNFVAWGLYHGVLLVGHASRPPPRAGACRARSRSPSRSCSSCSAGCSSACARPRHRRRVRRDARTARHRRRCPATSSLYIAIAAAIVFGLPEEWRWPVGALERRVRRRRRGALRRAASSVYTSHPFIYFRF